MTWRPRDFVVAAFFILLGFALSRVLPAWLWASLGLVGFGASLWWSARQNRRAGPSSKERRW